MCIRDSLDIDFFRKRHSGELLSRITNDIARIQMVVANMIPDLIRETFTIIALTGYVIYQSPKLAFYFLIIMPLAIFPLSKLAKKMRRYSKLSQESTADMTKRLEEILSNIEVIKSHSSQPFEEGRFEAENKNVFHFIMKQTKTNALTSPVMEILGAVAIGLVIYVGGMEVINGHMSVGSFFAFSAALFMLYDPIRRLSNLYNKAQDAIMANIRMLELLATKPMIIDGEHKLQETIESLAFENVSLDYDNHRALANFSFQFKKGNLYALVGESGAGKSSLVNLIVRFYDPTQGKITINDKQLAHYTLASLHAKIAYVTQHILIFNDTIAANIAYGKPIDEAKIKQALIKSHAIEFVSKLPDGINTVLSQGGTNLSGGQKQRIALARALYKEPDVLILDEATSALDNTSQKLIQNVLEELKADMITIAVAHRLSSVIHADSLLVFASGHLMCHGKHQQLEQSCPEYQRLLGVS